MITFRIMTPEDGDRRIVWDRRNEIQLADAKKLFDELVEQGLVPYKVDSKGKATTKVMDQFDPEAEEVIFLPISLVTGG